MNASKVVRNRRPAKYLLFARARTCAIHIRMLLSYRVTTSTRVYASNIKAKQLSKSRLRVEKFNWDYATSTSDSNADVKINGTEVPSLALISLIRSLRGHHCSRVARSDVAIVV